MCQYVTKIHSLKRKLFPIIKKCLTLTSNYDLDIDVVYIKGKVFNTDLVSKYEENPFTNKGVMANVAKFSTLNS